MNKSRCFQIFIFTVLTTVTISCDPTFFARINNITEEEIVLELQFDKSEIQSVWGNRPFLPYLKGRINGGGVVIEFDSIALISKILIKPDDFFTIEQAVGFRPNFFGIKKIQVFKNDTITLDTKESMINAFKEINTRQFYLDIK